MQPGSTLNTGTAKTFKIVTPEKIACGVFATSAEMRHTSGHFLFDFVFDTPTSEHYLVSRIYSTPQHCARFLRALNESVTKFEAKFGTIQREPPPPRAPESQEAKPPATQDDPTPTSTPPSKEEARLVKTSEEASIGVFSTSVTIQYNEETFLIDFFCAQPNSERLVVSRVIVTPKHCKRLISAIRENIEMYESHFGPIKPPPPPPPPK